jgi:hypothetical protein
MIDKDIFLAAMTQMGEKESADDKSEEGQSSECIKHSMVLQSAENLLQ